MAMLPPPQANPMMMLQQLLQQSRQGGNAQQIDPRAGAIEQYMAQQGQGSQMPIVHPDVQQWRGTHPDDRVMTDQGADDGPDDDDGSAAPMSDEELLAHVHKNMGVDDALDDEARTQEAGQREDAYRDSLPPRGQRRFRDFQDENNGRGPITDSEYDAVFGHGATERTMGGVDAYDRGFLKEDNRGNDITQFRRRRKNAPAGQRFQDLNDEND